MDASDTHSRTQSVANDSNSPANASVTSVRPRHLLVMQNRAQTSQGASEANRTRRAHADVRSILRTTREDLAQTPERVRTPQTDSKESGLPARSLKPCTEEPKRLRNLLDASVTHSARIDEIAVKTAENLSTTQNKKSHRTYL